AHLGARPGVVRRVHAAQRGGVRAVPADEPRRDGAVPGEEAVRTRVTPLLRDEARRYALRFACDDCAHWDGTRCGEGWPTRVERDSIDARDEVVFCKQFELA